MRGTAPLVLCALVVVAKMQKRCIRLPYWTCLECSLKAEHGHPQMASRLQACILLTPGILLLQSLHKTTISATHTNTSRRRKTSDATEHTHHLELLPRDIHPRGEEDA